MSRALENILKKFFPEFFNEAKNTSRQLNISP